MIDRIGRLVALALVFAVGLAIGIAGSCGSDTQAPYTTESGSDKAQTWTCSMHPQIKLPEPGQCPICGMDLIALTTDDDGERATSPQRVVMSERAKLLAKLKSEPVRRADASVELHLLGRLSYDETKVRTITSWTDGRIDRLFVSAVGEKVKRGQMIASQYSPEVYAAQAELVQAKVLVDNLKNALPVARQAAESSLDAARTRLRLLGVKPMRSDKISAKTRPSRNVAITAKYDGTIVEQMVHEGAYVKAGMPIFRVAQLDEIWAQLDAYEGDLATVQLEQKVTLVVSSFPGETFEGVVAFIDPIVDPRTRTAQIRVEVPNKDGRLSPGMFADAVIHARDGEGAEPPLVIPETAPLFTGKRSLVYVEVPDTSKPTYEARVVQLGAKAGDVYPVAAGLREGERIVTRGAFVIDSDLQIRGGNSMMTVEDDAAQDAREPVRVTDKFMRGWARVVTAYLDLHSALSRDDQAASAKAIAELGRQAAGFDPRSPDKAREVYLTMRDKITGEARRGAKSEDMAMMRRAFGAISEHLIIATIRFGNPTHAPLRLAYCPMAFDDRGAHWLQRAEGIENPYFGASMFACGEIQDTAQADGRLTKSASSGHEH